MYKFVSSNCFTFRSRSKGVPTGLSTGPDLGVGNSGLEDVILVPYSPDSLAIDIDHNGRKAECQGDSSDGIEDSLWSPHREPVIEENYTLWSGFCDQQKDIS